MTSQQQMRTFLDRLWREPWDEEQHRLTIWTLPDRQSFHAATPTAAVEHAASCAGDVYVGAALRRVGLARHQRGGKRDCTLLPAAYADLDVADGVHRKAGIFPSIEAAQDALDHLPIKPSIIVASGGGLQAWWVFNEPIPCAEPDEIIEAERVLAGWHAVVAGVAEPHTIDSVWNLDRILRLPGTENCKEEPKRPVKLLASDGPDCEPSDLLEYVPQGWSAPRLRPPTEPFACSVTETPGIPYIVSIALENDPKLAATWERRTKFDSQSEYDQSIASLLARNGAKNQDIVDAINHHRGRAGEPIKHPDYYRLTIETARRDLEDSQEAEEFHECVLESRATGAPVDTSLDQARAMIRTHTGVPVVRVIQYGETLVERCAYKVVVQLPGGEQEHPMTQTMFRQPAGWEELAIEIGVANLKPRPKPMVWRSCRVALKRLTEVDSASEEYGDTAHLLDLIEEYGRGAARVESPYSRSAAGVLTEQMPFVWEGRLYIHRAAFSRWLTNSREAIDRRLLLSMLRAIGAENRTFVARLPTGKDTSGAVGRSYWSVPSEGKTIALCREEKMKIQKVPSGP